MTIGPGKVIIRQEHSTLKDVAYFYKRRDYMSNELRDEVAALKNRISDLVDEINSLKHDLLKLREDTAEDIKDLYRRTG
ncbi:hypothetical protein CMI37_14080 [Candidatus Pacearchaeota archaeon]|nr:hypothetical protein [Candidatus Pacearchaeota archaeon]